MYSTYLLGFTFIGVISIWKYVFGALALYIVFSAGSDAISDFMSEGNEMGGVTSDATDALPVTQQELFDPSAFKPINVDKSVSDTNQPVDFLPPLPPSAPKLVI